MTNSESAGIDTLARKAESTLSSAGRTSSSVNELLTELRLAVANDENAGTILGPLIGRLQAAQRSAPADQPNWIPVAEGHVAIGHRPKVKSIRRMHGLGATHLLTLLSESEGAEDIGREACKAGLHWIWLPMDSADPPRGERRAEIIDVFERWRTALTDGARVFVHCSAGIHRTGMISYAFLRHLGYSATMANDTLSKLRRETADGVGDERVRWGEQFA